MTTKTFELGDILSVTTGRLVSRRHMDGIYEVMGFLIQDYGITTLGLLDMADPCKVELLTQFPQLAKVEVPEFNVERDGVEVIWSWLEAEEAKYGKYFEVSPMLQPKSPRNDLDIIKSIRGNLDDVIVVYPDDLNRG